MLADELAQVALAGDEADDRDGTPGVPAFDEVGDLLDLPGDELLVAHGVGEPEDQFVEEEHQSVVAETLGVRGDLGQAAVEGDEPLRVLPGVLGENGQPAGE